MNAIFALKRINALLLIRDENQQQHSQFIDALNKLFDGASKPKINCNQSTKNIKVQGRDWWSNLCFHWGLARKLKSSIKGKKALEIYGIDGRRLSLSNGLDLRQILQRHVDLTHPVLNSWFGQPPKADTAKIGFDPTFSLSHRPIKVDKSAPVITPSAIALLAILHWYRFNPIHAFQIFYCAMRELEPAYKGYVKRIVVSVTVALFLSGVKQMLSKRTVRMLCLTSNSIFLETLRAMTLSFAQNEVIEVQHGIASPVFDPYFLSYKPSLDKFKGGRFDIIPLLKAPFCVPAVRTPRFEMHERPSNTGLFAAFNKIAPNWNDPGNSIEERVSLLTDKIYALVEPVIDHDRPILAIFGGTDLSNDFYQGPNAHTELSITQDIQNRLAKNGPNPTTLYLPHPVNPKLHSIKLANGSELTIFENSQAAYFYADYAFALYSAALFEAAAIGARAFTPMTNQIKIFHSFMLDNVIHPTEVSSSALNAALTQFTEVKLQGIRDHKSKISARLTKFLTSE